MCYAVASRPAFAASADANRTMVRMCMDWLLLACATENVLVQNP